MFMVAIKTVVFVEHILIDDTLINDTQVNDLLLRFLIKIFSTFVMDSLSSYYNTCFCFCFCLVLKVEHLVWASCDLVQVFNLSGTLFYRQFIKVICSPRDLYTVLQLLRRLELVNGCGNPEYNVWLNEVLRWTRLYQYRCLFLTRRYILISSNYYYSLFFYANCWHNLQLLHDCHFRTGIEHKQNIITFAFLSHLCVSKYLQGFMVLYHGNLTVSFLIFLSWIVNKVKQLGGRTNFKSRSLFIQHIQMMWRIHFFYKPFLRTHV